MQIVDIYLKEFFHVHKSVLESKYPGIKYKRFLEEFCEYENVGPKDYFSKEKSKFLEEISIGKPIEYIQNKAYFYRSMFYVDERVLIPRFETEILVEDTLSWINKESKNVLRIAEVGTGSFAIGISILMDVKKKLQFCGGDISREALDVSEINLFRHKQVVSHHHDVSLFLSDRLENFSGSFDCIVSNPPYIRLIEDKEGVHQQAHLYEPHVALYLDDAKFDSWFDYFFKEASAKLHTNGAFFMEGHEDSLLHLQSLALKYFKKVNLKNDYTNRLRFLHAFK